MRCAVNSITAVILQLLLFGNVNCWFGGDSETKILLQDVKAITLSSGKSTRGRRSTVQQLECITGGSASCNVFKPRVVQCVNAGFDGVDVQWECKTDMDNNIRFGSIDVTCEGFDYPEDPYITAGSCGLRYNFDYTKDGHNNNQHDYGYGQQHHHHEDTRNNYQSKSNYYSKKSSSGFLSGIADLIVYCAIGLMLWAFYKTCISPSRGNVGDTTYSSTSDDYPTGGGGGTGGYGWNTGGGGYNGNNYGGTDDYSGNCGGGRRRGMGGTGRFWSGAVTGGLLGYMMGNRGGNRTGGGWFGGGSNYHSGGSGGWGGGGSSFSGGGGTRSASGFGGTSRR